MRIFLDSCVILSQLPRSLLLQAAKSGHCALFFSQSVEEECLHVARRKGMEEEISAAFVELKLYAQKENPAEGIDFWLPDENDHHVILGALGAQSEIIATENLRDFPKAALHPLGLEARAPDQILHHLALNDKINLDEYEIKKLKSAKLYKTAKLAKKKLHE